MTNRQHQLIMSLYVRCDEINEEIGKLDYADMKRLELIGAHSELLLLADKLKCQFKAEQEALEKINFISDKVNINA